MTRFVVSLILIVVIISGCASFSSHPVEFRAAPNTSFTLNSDRFDAIEIQPSEIQLWEGSDLVGTIMTVETNPQSKTAINEVKQGFVEAQKGPGAPSELQLPESAYGFASTFRGYTTAFIAVAEYNESWITISVKDDLFDEVLSSIAIR